MKIRKYQAGAIIYTPTPTGGQATSTQASASSSSASEKPEKITGTMLKEIMDQLKEDGLPADVEQILNYAARYLDKSSHLTDMSLFGGKDTEYNIKDWINITKLVKEAKWNKELYDDASDKLKEEDAWNDVATDTNGKIWLSDGKNLSKVSVSEYVKEREKLAEIGYVPISYNTLGDLRSRYFGFDKNGMLEDMKAAVGMKSITTQLVDIVTKFEAIETSKYKFSQGTDRIRDASGRSYQLEAVKDGLEALTSGGPSGYYKLTQKTKVDKSNVEDALDYLWNSLGDSAQNAVRAKLAVEGDNPNNGDAVKAFLADIISFHARNKVDVNFDSSATNYDPNGTGKKGGSSAESKIAQDYISRFATLDLPIAGYDTIVPHAAKIADSGAMLVKTLNGGLVRDQKTKEGLKDVTIDELLSRAEFAQAVDQSNISFGNKSLNQTDLKKIAFQGGEVNVAMLPYKQDPTTGKIVPDFDSLNAFNQIQEILNEKGIINEFRLAEECKKRGLNYNSIKHDKKTNTITFKNTMAFAYVTGLAGDKTIDLSDDNKRMLEKIEGDDKSDFADIYNRIITYNELGINKSSKRYNKFNSSNKNHIYEGRVYFAMPNAQRGLLMSSNGQYRDKSDFTDFIAKGQVNDYEVARVRQIQENDPDYDYKVQTLGKF